LNSEILTAESELELRKLNRNQKFLKKNHDLKSEISVESEQKNMNALLLIIFLLNSSSELKSEISAELEFKKFNQNQKFQQ